MKQSDVESILISAGFSVDTSGGFFGRHYTLPASNGWAISVYATSAGNPFLGTANPDVVEKVSFTLGSKGTCHCCRSLPSLKRHIGKIIQELIRVSQNEHLLKCPKCGKRFVHAKQPLSGQKWKPFLSCDGMIVTGHARNKGIECDGISNKLPAVVTYQ